MSAMGLPSYESAAAAGGFQLRIASAGTLIHKPSRVDTRDHLNVSAANILMYDSAGFGALLEANSVPGTRGSGATTLIGRARSGIGLRRFGKLCGRSVGARGRGPAADRRSRLRGAEQSATAVVIRSVRCRTGAAEIRCR